MAAAMPGVMSTFPPTFLFYACSTQQWELIFHLVHTCSNDRKYCLYFISIWTWNTITFITVLPAGLFISVATHGSRIAGGIYSLICSVARSDFFNSTNITYQWFNESSKPRAQVKNQADLTFNPLQLHHAGEYICVVTLSGFPNLNGNLSQSVSHNISVQGKLH